MVARIADPNGLALTTSYTYYNTTAGDGHYSKLQSVTNPDGSWILYNYFDDFAHWGELASVSTPWQDAPATYGAATSSNCKITTYNYALQVYDLDVSGSEPQTTSVYQTLNAGSQTSINGVMTAESSITPSVWQLTTALYYSAFYGNEPMRTDTVKSYSGSGVEQTTVKTVFNNTADPTYGGKLYSQINPDGTKISASYWNGIMYSWLGDPVSWNATYILQQASSTNLVSNYLSGTATQEDPSAILYATDGTTNNNAIDPVWMTPFKSFRRQIVNDSFGHPWYDLNEVFTGTGFQIISWRITGITFDGLLLTDEDGSGTITKRSYIDGQVNYLTNSDGTQTQYYFDPLMRIQQTEFKTAPAYSTYPALGAVETYFTYDAAGRELTSMKEPSGGGTTLSTANAYNLAGLQTSQTDSSGLVTSFSYTNGARTVTTTFPNGSTRVTDKHLDGAAKSITGNAQVNQFVASVVNGDGTVTTTTNLGTSGSSRLSTVQSDWLGRTISQTQPAFGGGTFTKQSIYNTSGQLTKTTQTGMAATLYQYDGLGQLQYTGLDVNNNGILDLGGSDRIAETRTQVYEDSNSIWWNQTLTYVFNQTGNSTPVLESEVRQKLIPFITTVTSETDSYDYFRNLTVETLNINEVNPSENGINTTIVTDTTTLPNSSVPRIGVKYNGVLMSSQTPQNIVTTYQYDGLYREISEIDPRKGTSSTAYFTSGAGENGQVSSHTDAGGNATSYTYDSTDGRLFSQTDPLGDIVYHAYDHVGREIKTWGTGTFPVEYAFDAYGAQIAMRTFRSTSLNFSSSTWPLSDDGGDPQNPIPTSWTNGDTTSWAFDPATGLLTSKKDAAGQSVVYTYNPNATLAKRTWARGVSTTYSYDPNTAEQIGISYSDGSPGLTYTFDRLGHGSSVVQAYSGSTLTTGLQYNVPGKLTQETLDSSYFSGRQLVYQLDTSNAGTLGRTIGYQMGTSASPSLDEGSSLAYDTDGRLNAVGLTGGPTFSYAFAANSNLIGSVTDSPDNWTQARTWDTHRDLLDLVQTSVGSTVEGAFTYALDASGRRTSKLQTGSLFSRYPATGLVDAYTYDSKSEVTADQAYQSNNPASLTTKVLGRGFTFAYDPIGNRTTSAVDATQTTSYTENALNQITSRTVPGYFAASGFAPTGATVTLNGTAIPSGQFAGQYYLENVTATNSSAPLWLTAQSSSSLGGSVTANAFIPQTPEASTYDADGNIITDGRWNYFWDAENRLKAIETFGNQAGNSKSIWNSGVPLIHIDFKYDYKGRRISKLISTWSGSAFVASSETRYAYENWNLLADYSVSGSSLSLAHSYLWGIDLSGRIHGAGGVGGLLAMISASGAIELPVYDGNGNVQALTDRLTAQMTAAYEYSPYGQPLRTIGTDALVNPFRFSTKYTDNETDLVYYGRRYYNPALGRFLGRDPKQEKGGLHLYGFVGNNGINRWDYLGMDGSPYASGFNATWNSQTLGNLNPNGNLDPTTVSNNVQQTAHYVAAYGAYNSGGGNNGGGGFMTGAFTPLPGENDWTQVTSDNPTTAGPDTSNSTTNPFTIDTTLLGSSLPGNGGGPDINLGPASSGPITDLNSPSDANNAALAAAATDGVGSAPAGYAVQQSWTTAHGGTNAVLYYNATTGATILAYQGTSSLSDIGTDIYNALGGQSTRYTSAVAIAQGVQDQYPGTALTGVSLGGGEAALASVQTGMTAYTFNAAGVNPNNYNITGGTSQITNYSVATDALTNLQAITPFPSALGSQVTLSPGNLWYALNPFAAHGSGSILAAMGGGG
jgi:RHS repeat-associated protein